MDAAPDQNDSLWERISTAETEGDSFLGCATVLMPFNASGATALGTTVFAAATGTSGWIAAAAVTGTAVFNDGAGAAEREREGERNTALLSEGAIGEDIPPSEGTMEIPTGARDIPAATRTWAAPGEAKTTQSVTAMIGWIFMD